MYRSLLVALALATSLWTSAAPLAHADELSNWRLTATEAARDVNSFWARTAPVYGFSYAPPRLTLLSVDTITHSACDSREDSMGVQDHAYCPMDSTVYLDVDSDDDHSVATLVDDERAYIVAVIVAHEAGHHIQDLLGLFDKPTQPRSIDVELQADCLSGFALAGSVHKKEISANLADIAQFSTEAADPAGTKATDPDAHGTAAQRNAAFLSGFTTAPGARACGL